MEAFTLAWLIFNPPSNCDRVLNLRLQKWITFAVCCEVKFKLKLEQHATSSLSWANFVAWEMANVSSRWITIWIGDLWDHCEQFVINRPSFKSDQKHFQLYKRKGRISDIINLQTCDSGWLMPLCACGFIKKKIHLRTFSIKNLSQVQQVQECLFSNLHSHFTDRKIYQFQLRIKPLLSFAFELFFEAILTCDVKPTTAVFRFVKRGKTWRFHAKTTSNMLSEFKAAI